MSAALRNWRWCLFAFSTLVAGFLGGWYLCIAVFRPTDSQFLRTTTSAYLKNATERAIQAHISYNDCRLEVPSEDERSGTNVVKFGVCRYEIDGATYSFSVALNALANIEWRE